MPTSYRPKGSQKVEKKMDSVVGIRSGPHLAGTFDWDPYGESILSVIEKVAMPNVLSSREVFGVFGLKSPSSYIAGDPDDVHPKDYARLEWLAGWAPSTLSASLHGAYRAPGNPPARGRRAPLTRSTLVRFCTRCAENGVHLALFQVSELLVCPIHDQALEEHCFNCRFTLRRYEFAADELRTIVCRRCGWAYPLTGSAASNDALRIAKRTTVGSLVGWLKTLRETIGGNGAPIQIMSTPGAVRPLTHYHALMPGPEWIERCMHAGSRTRQRIVDLESAVGRRTPPRGPTPRPDSTVLNARARAITSDRARRMERDLVDTFNLTGLKDGAFLSSTGYLRRLVDDEASVAALAFRWWRRFLTPRPLEHVRVEQHTPMWSSRDSVPLWKLWEDVCAGASALLRTEVAKGGFLCEVISYWTDSLLRSLYLSLIGRAAMFSYGKVEQTNILGAAEETGSMPLVVLRADRERMTLVEVTNVAPDLDFVTLFRSGYSGFEEERLTDPFRPDPIHELIALPEKERRRSMERLNQLTGRA